MKTTSDRSRQLATRLLVSCLCCLALSPAIGAEDAAGHAASVPALAAAEQTAADALIAKHGKAALTDCRMYVGKDASATAILGTVEHLVSKNADVNAKDDNGLTPRSISSPCPGPPSRRTGETRTTDSLTPQSILR